MKRKKFIQFGSSALLAGMAYPWLNACAGSRNNDYFVVEPEPSDEVLTNPGIGFETFNRFNSDMKDPALVNYPECSISYHRIYWDKLEPEEGRYNFELLDEILEKCHHENQDLALRFMPVSTSIKAGAPKWYMEKAKGYYFDRQGSKGWSPDYNDPYYLGKQEAMISAFGERYNGHRRMDRMEIGGYGFWSEWHVSHSEIPEITDENAFKLIDMHYKYWGKTNLMMLINHEEGLRYSISKGAGWRADSLGDYGHFSDVWSHMSNAYPQKFERVPELQEAWKRGPVAFEPPGSMTALEQDVPIKGGGYKNMWDKALEWHGSAYNAKSGAIPDSQVPSIKEFLKSCGYRFYMKQIRIPKTISQSERMLPLEFTIVNTGVSPVYRKYKMAVRLTGNNRHTMIFATANLNSWLPGEHQIRELIPIPDSLEKGTYNIALGIVHPDEEKPVIRFANKGRSVDGWLPLEGASVKIKA